MVSASRILIVIAVSLILVSLLGIGAYAKSPDELADELRRELPKDYKSSSKIGVAVKSLKTGRMIFSHNGDQAFVPASNAKIIISAAALRLLKPDYRFKTEFYTRGEMNGGTLIGHLYIKGYGDPTVTSSDLKFIAAELKRKGLDEIKGSIYVDESYFDTVRYGAGWKKEWKGVAYSPQISALSLNYNTIDLNIYPTRLGKRARVEIEPKGSGLRVLNETVTSNRRGKLYGALSEDGHNIVVSGRISPKSGGLTVTKSVNEPAIYFGNSMKTHLEEAGIDVSGGVGKAVVHADYAELIYTHYSDILERVMSEYNKSSINIIGENTIKLLGAKFTSPPGTWKNGTFVVGKFLGFVGVKDKVRLIDGSGLSPQNKVTPKSLVEVLAFSYRNKVFSHEFITSLSIGGVDGTLRNRFKSLDIEGRVMAKTGYLKGVRALSGYVFTKTGDVLAFSILSNGLGRKVKLIQRNMLVKMVECCSNIYTGNK